MHSPILRFKQGFIVYIMTWFAIAVIHSLALFYFINLDLRNAIFDSIVFNTVYFGLSLSLWYPAKFINFERSSSISIAINHAAASFITSLLWIGVSYFILTSFISEDSKYISFLDRSLVWRFIIGLLFYSIIVSINYITIYYNSFREKLLKEAELNSLIKEAELKTLKYQINPHFIFNSLNSISSLTISNPSKAREMTIKLSSFMRNTLSKNEKQKNKLSEELDNIKIYLDIEKVRFEDKFELVEEIGEECKKVEVPNMILQPLFENAIKHGVYESIEKVTITLRCKRENNYLKISVSNVYDKDTTPRKGEGIGLRNINNRLKLIYNLNNLLQIEDKENLFTVNIFIPLKEQ